MSKEELEERLKLCAVCDAAGQWARCERCWLCWLQEGEMK